ncbi:DUF86 domain-containing protein, partial [Patescibacteria group bacterium]|nr:DUF86 domain-containing protein [Patescibacteria group bacterium]
MNARDTTDYIDDIKVSINDINTFTKKLTGERFENDKKTQYAVIRSLEIIGEAVRKIPDEVKAKHPEIPWKKIT